MGGFPDATLTDFGEPIMRAVYAETTDEVEALERGLEAVSDCVLRVVLLHYAPTSSTIEGEPRGIWAFLGSDRLGRPIAEHAPDLVLHGHGHAGTYEGFIGAVPVYNVSLPGHGPGLRGLRAGRYNGTRCFCPPRRRGDSSPKGGSLSILWIILIVILVLALLGFFSRGYW